MDQDPLEVLNRVFGYPHFRGAQQEVIERVLDGGDALVLMPTGGGKSLCYQIPALLRPGTGIVVSPLIALMQDQVDALRQLGVRAAFLNSSLAGDEQSRVERALLAGDLDLLYVAPERLLTERFLDLLGRVPVALFAIDEAHCVSQWGHDFRPEYIQLNLLHERWPAVPRIAVTATADAPTRREIVTRLALEQAAQFVSSFDRANIRYHVTEKREPRQQLVAFLRGEHPEDAGIVYCLSRRKVEETAEHLCVQGFKALAYHAGLPAEQRRTHQAQFLRGEGVIVVATIAFGMGIDKPDVRFVAHLDLPKSLEAYYQETGRAGRDGQPADAWMTYGLGDVVALRRFIEESEAEEQFKRVEMHKLNALLGFCETTQCRRQVMLNYFGEQLPAPCGNCDTCLTPVASWDGTLAAQKAMSCIFRTGQRFGVNYLIEVLRGKDDERIRRYGHDQISTFGIGADFSVEQWRSVYRQLVAAGLVAVDIEGHGALQLTESSRPVLRGERTLHLRRDPERRPAKTRGEPRPARVQTPLDPDENAGLIPRHIETKGAPNEWEQENILQATKWLRRAKIPEVLSESFCRDLHRRMFNKTWKWAGTFRKSDKNIGCDWALIAVKLNQLLGNAQYWVENGTFSRFTPAARRLSCGCWVGPMRCARAPSSRWPNPCSMAATPGAIPP